MSEELQKIQELVSKYNDVLLNSMSIALAEDLINLIVVNADDKEFKLQELVKDKTAFRALVTKEFLKQNSGSVLSDLRSMENEFESDMVKSKNLKSGQKKMSL